MKTVEEIKSAIEAAVPGAAVGACPESQRLGPALAQACARAAPSRWPKFLRDDAELAFDFLSNVTGIDWPDKEITEKVKVTRQAGEDYGRGGATTVEETVEETRNRLEPGCLEAVYHLYSVEKKHGPVVLSACAPSTGTNMSSCLR